MSETTTSICKSTAKDVFVRGRSLTTELMGELTFTEMIFFQILGRMPTDAQTAVIDACLVALMEHGLTPTAVTARMTYSSAPESMQAAIAAGLCSVGSLYVGTMEGCAQVLAELAEADADEAACRAMVVRHREQGERLPGFGHPQHTPDDPRAVRLFEIASEVGVAGRHVELLQRLGEALDEVAGKHVTINVTGAIAAVLLDCDVPVEIMRGFAVISRCAGLVGHIREEQKRPALHALWHGAETAVPYEPGE